MGMPLRLGLSLLVCSSAVPAAPFSHGLFDRVLQAHVDTSGRVDYPALQASRAPLDAYVDSLGRTSPRSHPERFPSRAHELAYWVNAYNAFVLRGVIDAYPIGSVKDLAIANGFFQGIGFVAGGQELTLDQIENQIIRPVYREPRIHVAINCGAASCPPLGRRALAGETLDTQLDEAMRAFARSPRFVRLDRPGSALHLSKILEWFGQDFLQPPERPAIVDYLLPYLPPADADYLRAHPGVALVYDDYDWSLNGQSPPAAD